MPQFEYKVVPTPRRPKRAKGVKGNSARFANVLTDAINAEAAGGWEFVRTETLPMEAKPGIFARRVEMFQSVMVFRRGIYDPREEAGPVRAAPVIASVAAAGTLQDHHAEPDHQAEPVAPEHAALTADRGPEPPVALPDHAYETPPEPSFAPEDASAAQEDAVPTVEFDAEDIDPLKKVVEANRGSNRP